MPPDSPPPAHPPYMSLKPQAPLFIIMNAGSGHQDTAQAMAAIRQVLAEAGRHFEIIEVKQASELGQIAQQVVDKARTQGGVVVMAGGDGSINTVAEALLGSGCPFGVLPQGTFNYFSRTHGIPQDTAEATRVLLADKAYAVQVGTVNDKVFLVNASLGLYPLLLEDREAYKQKYGRSRFVAFIAGVLTILRQRSQLHLSMRKASEVRDIHTPTLFVGNNRLQLEQIGIPQAQAVEDGALTAVTVRPVSTLGMLKLMLYGTFGKLGDADKVISFTFRQLEVSQPRLFGPGTVKVATDGETFWLRQPLEFKLADQPLYLLKPSSPATPSSVEQPA